VNSLSLDTVLDLDLAESPAADGLDRAAAGRDPDLVDGLAADSLDLDLRVCLAAADRDLLAADRDRDRKLVALPHVLLRDERYALRGHVGWLYPTHCFGGVA
jgi:hypothetical protein